MKEIKRALEHLEAVFILELSRESEKLIHQKENFRALHDERN